MMASKSSGSSGPDSVIEKRQFADNLPLAAHSYAAGRQSRLAENFHGATLDTQQALADVPFVEEKFSGPAGRKPLVDRLCPLLV